MTELTLSPVSWLSIFGAGLGASLGLGLAIPRQFDRSRLAMGSVLVVGSVAQLAIALDHASGQPLTGLEQAEGTLGFLMGPLLLWFVRSRLATGASPRLHPLHFMPALSCVSYALLSQTELLSWKFPLELMLIHQFSYTIYCWLLTGNASISRKNRQTAYPVRAVLTFFVLLHAAQLFRYLGADLVWLQDIVPITMTAGFVFLAATGLRASVLRSHAVAPQRQRGSAEQERADRQLAALCQLMQHDKVYRDTELTLPELAKQLGSRPQSLSSLLNQHVGQSFFEYVNGFRVEDAKRRLADPHNDRYTIEAIAEAAGFKSRATFYSCFRRLEGTTPNQYRKRIRKRQGGETCA